MQNIARYALAATILALGMVASSALISRFFVRVQQQKEIRVTGYAQAPVTSDIGQLDVAVSMQSADRAQTYKAARDLADSIADRVHKGAPADAQISLANADITTVYQRNEKGEPTGRIDSYVVSQTVLVESSDVKWIKQLSWDLNELIGQGYDLRIGKPTFLVRSLDATKRDLLQKATVDGYQRAQMVAKNSGARVGHLLAARQGVFQITEPNSTETSDYGTYDTSTIMKSIKAVVELEYAVE